MVKYIFAGLYFGIKSRPRSFTPYFNTLLGVAVCVNLTILNLLLFINKNPLPRPLDANDFFISGLASCGIIMLIVRLYAPERKLEKIVMSKADIRMIYSSFVIYYLLNGSFLIYFLYKHSQNLPS